MCVRCHLCPVSAYLRFRDLDVLLNLSGTPQRGFCIQLREEKRREEKRREEKRREEKMIQVSQIKVSRWTSSQDNIKQWSELSGSLPDRCQIVTGAKKRKKERKKCTMHLNYSKLQSLIQVKDQNLSEGCEEIKSSIFSHSYHIRLSQVQNTQNTHAKY